MKKIDLFYKKLIGNEELLEQFATALIDGTIIDFFTSQGMDPKISELSNLLDRLQKDESEIYNRILTDVDDEPLLDIPSEVLDDMANAFSDTEIYTSPPELLINYNEKYKDSTPILHRTEIIRQILSCLILQFKSNVLLVGPAGVGKTKIVEDIANQLSQDFALLPLQLRGYTIYELPLSGLIAGSNLVGDVECKTRKVIDFASNIANKAILFIDEIHVLTGNERSYGIVAQSLKPALARGIIKVIGATTSQEANDLLKDPALNRRFNKIVVDELTKEQTKSALLEMRDEFAEHYEGKIYLSRNAISEAIDAADAYKIAGSHRPDNVITLIDRAMADAYVSNCGNIKNPIRLTPKHIINTARKLTSGKIIDSNVDIDALRNALSVIKGQDIVINRIIDCIKRDSMDIFEHARPLSLLFFGGSGTGKTETAYILSMVITGSPPITLNMSEFGERSSLSRIVGVHAGYLGCDAKTELPFDILESNPRQVVLLDQLDKANVVVQRLFLSVLENGTLQLANNRMIDFTKAIIIATANAGSNVVKSASIGFTANNEMETETISLRGLSRYFGNGLLNRFDKVLHFKSISEQVFAEIIRDKYQHEAEKLKRLRKANDDLPDTLPDDVVDRLVHDNYDPAFGARPVARIVREYIEDILLASDTREN